MSLVAFDDHVDPTKSFDMGTSAKAKADSAARLSESVGSLQARGGTAIYEAAKSAYMEALARRRADPERFYSVVVMTDGENNTGMDYKGFSDWFASLPESDRGIKIFPVQFGEAKASELQVLASTSGGKLFNSRKSSLASIFKEIRGYQ